MELKNQKRLTPDIIYEDERFLAVNKPAGLLVHRTAKSNIKYQKEKIKSGHPAEEKTLVNWLLARYPDIKEVGDDPATRPGIVHRLDRETSGIILVAKTQKYFDYLKNAFSKPADAKDISGARVGEGGAYGRRDSRADWD